ncbi:MAG: MMPL family transporter [SAR324 cluster bacterium]|nr:MMPL family transporter [SAR324 cluster bacterium]
MMKFFANISTKYPWLMFVVVIAVTGFMMNQIKTKLKVEPDMTKFMPNSMPTTKANDYLKKNYNFKDSMLVGIEATEGTLMTTERFRAMENIILAINELKMTKTFDSILTGKKENLTFGLGIDTENISGLANLENVILDTETGSVVTGSVIKKLKTELGIVSLAGFEERLPTKDADLERLMEPLIKLVMENRLFKNNVLSEDQTASTIRIPMVRKWDYKRRYTVSELTTALDPEALKRRYQGQDSLFPYTIYNKKLGDVTYDDAFIAAHSQKLAEIFQNYLNSKLDPIFGDYPELEKMLEVPLTAPTFLEILKVLEQREFNLHPEMMTWENVNIGLWETLLPELDPASRENLEFQIGNVMNVYDLVLVYAEVNQILENNKVEGVKYYVAGTPVVLAVFSEMMGKDMGTLLPVGVVVIFLILAISFKSLRGVVIPLITVILSIIWTLGSMATVGTPLTALSSILPVVLLATGSAYGIHLLNRYYDDIKYSTHRKEVMNLAVRHVGWAIVMAATTTFAGFISLLSSDLSMIADFGLFTAVGVLYALFLTLTLSPALLSLWPLPKKVKKMHESDSDAEQQGSFVDGIMVMIAHLVIKNSKKIVIGSVVAIVAFATVVPQLEFEGGQMANFKPDNVLFQSDQLINKKLTGTNLFNVLFKFRDQVNLEGDWIQGELKTRSANFGASWSGFTAKNKIKLPAALEKINQSVAAKDAKEISDSLQLIADLMNEDFEVVTEEAEEETSDLGALDEASDDFGGLGDLGDSESTVEATIGSFADLSSEQVAGLKNLNQRLGMDESAWETTGAEILALRKVAAIESAKPMKKSYNLLFDLFATDVKQPQVLHKLVKLQDSVWGLQSPMVEVDGQMMTPTSFVTGPIDLIRTTYRVFFHDDKPEFDRLPNAETDNLSDSSLTDRGIIGVVLNQAQSGSRENFDAMISPDLKEFQINIIARQGLTAFVDGYQKNIQAELDQLFKENDPYMERVTITGYAPSIKELTSVIGNSQLKSIGLAFILVFIVTYFIFGSVIGGIYSILPLVLTVLGNFAAMWALGWKINTGTMLVASISIGIGVDYTIHFLERFKHQISLGEEIETAYINTTSGIGKAVLINATSVALGFLVLMLSDFVSNISMGMLMAGTMIYSSFGALVMLPALIIWTRPKFISKHTAFDESDDAQLLQEVTNH